MGSGPGALSSDHSAAFIGADEVGRANCPHGEAILTEITTRHPLFVGGQKQENFIKPAQSSENDRNALLT